MDRPPAEALLPVMLVEGKAKLAAHTKPHAAEVRCPRRHLLGAVVRTAHGPWVLCRTGLFGQPWRPAWWDEIGDTAALPVRCGSCPAGMVWFLDVTDPGSPRRFPPPTAVR
jgi:hypothetical protein